MIYDAAIIGGGPGGLSCALQLARSYRKVLLFDGGNQRSSYIPQLYNYPGFPLGISGREFLHRSRQQAEGFGAAIREEEAATVEKQADGFTVTAPSGVYRCRRLVLATGIMDRHPRIPNKFDFVGKTIYYCLDCDGYEFGDKDAVIFGHSRGAFLAALRLSRFARSLWIATNGEEPQWDQGAARKLEEMGIAVLTRKVDRILGEGGRMTGLAFSDGSIRKAEIGLSTYGAEVHNRLAVQLGLETLPNGHIIVNRDMETSLRGVFAVGDVTNNSQQVSLAVAGGIRAAIMMEKSFLREEHPEFLHQ